MRLCARADDMPLLAVEDREFLRTFLHAAFKDLMNTPCADTRVVLYREFDLIRESWEKHGYGLDS